MKEIYISIEQADNGWTVTYSYDDTDDKRIYEKKIFSNFNNVMTYINEKNLV